MTKLRDALQQAVSRMASENIPSAQLDAELLLAHALQNNRSWLHAHIDDALTTTAQIAFNDYVSRRLQREPIAYITGEKEFYGREFIVTPDTLIPRPETEDLVDLALRCEAKKVIDIGCGSGCIGITLKLERPEWDMELSDISDKALVVARQNAAALKANVTFSQSNLLSSVSSSRYDLIVANLPYVDEQWERSPETAFEPSLALFARDDGLVLMKQLFGQTKTFLSPQGHLLLEADPEQHPALIAYAANHNLNHEHTNGYAISFVRQP